MPEASRSSIGSSETLGPYPRADHGHTFMGWGGEAGQGKRRRARRVAAGHRCRRGTAGSRIACASRLPRARSCSYRLLEIRAVTCLSVLLGSQHRFLRESFDTRVSFQMKFGAGIRSLSIIHMASWRLDQEGKLGLITLRTEPFLLASAVTIFCAQ